MRYTITESRLRDIIREAVEEIVESYPQSLHDTLSKRDYISDKGEFDKKPWYNRFWQTVTGRKPKDPFPGRNVDDMAAQYVKDYNEQEHIGNGVEFNDGSRMHQRMRFDKKTKLPYFSRTFRYPKGPFDGDVYSQQNFEFDEDGNWQKRGPVYPYSEIAVGQEPADDQMGDNAESIRRMYRDSDRRVNDIGKDIKNYKSSRKK